MVTIVIYFLTVAVVELGVLVLRLPPLAALALAIPVGASVGYLGTRYVTFGPGIIAAAKRFCRHMRGS